MSGGTKLTALQLTFAPRPDTAQGMFSVSISKCNEILQTDHCLVCTAICQKVYSNPVCGCSPGLGLVQAERHHTPKSTPWSNRPDPAPLSITPGAQPHIKGAWEAAFRQSHKYGRREHPLETTEGGRAPLQRVPATKGRGRGPPGQPFKQRGQQELQGRGGGRRKASALGSGRRGLKGSSPRQASCLRPPRQAASSTPHNAEAEATSPPPSLSMETRVLNTGMPSSHPLAQGFRGAQTLTLLHQAGEAQRTWWVSQEHRGLPCPASVPTWAPWQWAPPTPSSIQEAPDVSPRAQAMASAWEAFSQLDPRRHRS